SYNAAVPSQNDGSVTTGGKQRLATLVCRDVLHIHLVFPGTMLHAVISVDDNVPLLLQVASSSGDKRPFFRGERRIVLSPHISQDHGRRTQRNPSRRSSRFASENGSKQ